MTASDQAKPRGAAMSPQQRAERIRQLLLTRKAPPLEEGDEIRKLSSNSTLYVILAMDDLFRAAGFKEAPSWEQYAVICGTIACLADSITQFTGLPREGVPYMVADSIHFLFSGPDRAKWPKTESTYNFALTQYKHMIGKPELNKRVDKIGASFFNFLSTDDQPSIGVMNAEFTALVMAPDVPDVISKKGEK